MKVITFSIQKGGTGKTSISNSVAVELAKKGPTLIIDADPQGNTTDWNGIENIQIELSDILSKDEYTEEDLDSAIQPTKTQNLYILPTAAIGGGLGSYQKYGASEDPMAFKRLLRKLGNKFKFCVIDTSPSFSGIETSALLASHEAVTVLKIDKFSTDGLTTFFDNLKKMQDRYLTDLPELSKIVLNCRDMRLVQHAVIVEQVQQLISNTNKKLYIVPVDQAFPKSQQLRITIDELSETKKETLTVIKNLAENLSHGIGADD